MANDPNCGVQTLSPVTYDHSWWALAYPDLARWVNPGMGQQLFTIAELFVDNTACSVFTNVPRRQSLLGLAMAHIAKLNAPIGGVAPNGSVGRVASAGEGSVNVSFEYQSSPGSEWWSQTQYGATFWAATARYRQARYHPGPQRFSQSWPPLYTQGRRGYP